MKLDTSGIDPEQLARFIDDEYALRIAAITFQPKGEASYSYIGDEPDGAHWLIKVQDTARTVDLEARLRAVSFLHVEGGLPQLLAPRRNRHGDCACRYARYTVSVYPFVEGVTVWEHGPSDAYAIAVAPLMAAFHKSASLLPFPVPEETFDNPFVGPILRALRTVEAPGSLANDYQERLRRLMLAQRADIFATLDKMRQLKAQARALELDRAITHGDPNWANILVDTAGGLHLIDWDDLAFGPPERDLVFFTDWGPGRFELFLRQYLARYGPVRLHPEVFAFYLYRWVAQEIADYSTRILFSNVDPAEDEHAWTELQPYLPAHHAELEAGVRRVEEVIRRVAG
jgi:thiamine kinase-like enzyme